MDIFYFKILAIILIFISGVIGGFIPIRKKLTEEKLDWLSFGNAFAGGIFLGAGLLHMLPDSIDNFSKLGLHIDYPIAALIAGAGFLFVLFLEKVLVKESSMDKLVDERHVYPYILFLVLAIHSIIAGMALGLEKALISSLAIFIAIIAHKGSAAFALSVSLVRNGFKPTLTRRAVLLFSIMTPIGVAIGAGLLQIEGSAVALNFEAVFDALAAGTFVYIAVMDIINEVFETSEK